jgi:hypothetical protein
MIIVLMSTGRDNAINDFKPEEENVSPEELQKQGLRILAHIIARSHLNKIRADSPIESLPDSKIIVKSGLKE